jgi:hypothetical protein
MEIRYKVTYSSAWIKPLIFYTNNKKELKKLIINGKDQQFKVDIDKCSVDDSIYYHEGGLVKHSYIYNGQKDFDQAVNKL